MRRALRPATFVFAAVLVSLAACSSPTAPAPSPANQIGAAAAHDVIAAPDTTNKSGVVLPNG